jgi:hypothetical protein
MRQRVVISCTTLPDRYWKLEKMIDSLKLQTYPIDAIYIALPKMMKRDNIPYGPLPKKITDVCNVVECEDYGPITKILGGLYMEDDPLTIIITVDDDKIYHRNMVSKLMKHHESYPNSAIGSSGMFLRYPCPMCAIYPNETNAIAYRIPKFSISKKGRKVDSIYGYPGALYVRNFFPKYEKIEKELLEYTSIDSSLMLNDDILISGFLSLKGIERRIFSDMPPVSPVLDDDGMDIRNPNEISYDLDKFFQRLNKATSIAKSNEMYQTMEYYDVYSESVYSIATIILVCAVVLLVFAYRIIISN